jgi:hypothetical protein
MLFKIGIKFTVSLSFTSVLDEFYLSITGFKTSISLRSEILSKIVCNQKNNLFNRYHYLILNCDKSQCDIHKHQKIWLKRYSIFGHFSVKINLYYHKLLDTFKIIISIKINLKSISLSYWKIYLLLATMIDF